MAIITQKIPANVAEVPIVDNQPVKEGDVLVRLDDGCSASACPERTNQPSAAPQGSMV